MSVYVLKLKIELKKNWKLLSKCYDSFSKTITIGQHLEVPIATATISNLFLGDANGTYDSVSLQSEFWKTSVLKEAIKWLDKT